MNAALVFTYGRPAPGREPMALEAFTDSFTFWGKLAADDKCDEPVAYLAPSGGGMMIIHGDRKMLLDIIDTADFRAVYFKAGFCVPDLDYKLLTAGDHVAEFMAAWASLGSEMGFM